MPVIQQLPGGQGLARTNRMTEYLLPCCLGRLLALKSDGCKATASALRLPKQAFQNAEERREELKQQMAVACSQLLRAPEEHQRNLRALLALTVDADTEASCFEACSCFGSLLHWGLCSSHGRQLIATTAAAKCMCRLINAVLDCRCCSTGGLTFFA